MTNKFDFVNAVSDEREAKDGWCKGGYTCVCIRCQKSYFGDKRSWSCADCAYEGSNDPADYKADTAGEQKPDAAPTRPEWIWYCESTSGVPVVSFGRWAKNPQQARYKLAEIQPTEHDHPVGEDREKAHQEDRLQTDRDWRLKINRVKDEKRSLTLECEGLARKQHLLLSALRSIADNTCCEGCQEAARVAREALEGVAST